MSACDMVSRGLAQQIVAAGEVEFQGFLSNVEHMSAGEMVDKEPAQGVYCAGGLQMATLEAAENFAKLDCDRNFLDPSCETVTANGKEKDAVPKSASNIFWEEAHEMEKQKNSRGESSEQGQRSSEGDLLSAGKQDAPKNDNMEREYISKSESVGGGSQAPKPPCKGFMQKCKEMVAGYLAPSTSTTRNDNPETQGENQVDQTQMQNPKPNLGEGEFSPKTSELQISPLSSEKQILEGDQIAGRTPIFRNAFDFEDEDLPEGINPQEQRPIWPGESTTFRSGSESILPEGGT